MPELPETETIARDLHGLVRGARLEGAVVDRGDVLREVDAVALDARVRGASIVRCWRRAKLVVLDLDTADRVVVQPRFTGALLLEGPDAPLPERESRFVRLHFPLADSRRLHYRDIRCLGTVALMDPVRWSGYESGLGTEPLDDAFTAGVFSGILRRSRQAVKRVVMDQRHVVGVGNIYANEALWRARVAPGREARALTATEGRRLHGALVDVLRESILHRGTSFRDYVDVRGERGTFVHHLAAYGRAGLPCLRCGRPLDVTHAVDGRSTVHCPHCQR